MDAPGQQLITPRIFCSDVGQCIGFVRVCGRIVEMDPGREHYVIDDGMYALSLLQTRQW